MAKNSEDILNEAMLGGLVLTDTEIYHKARVIRDVQSSHWENQIDQPK